MLTLLLLLSFSISSAFGNGQLVILQSPESVDFSGNDEIDGHTIPEIFSASLGLTVRRNSNWRGITIKNPFGLAEVAVIVAFEGISSLGDFEKVPVYPISPSEDENKAWRDLRDDILERYPTINSKKLERIELASEINDPVSVETSHLDISNPEDAYVLQDLQELNRLTASYKKNLNLDGEPNVKWIVVSSLHPLSDVRGENSETTLEAKSLMRATLSDLANAVQKASKGKSIVAVIASDGSHTRHGRSTPEANNSTMPGNRATVYSENYPAIFNIILWFTVAFIFSLIATSYFIAAMDPGRDSIIYRMTSNRMKKDS